MQHGLFVKMKKMTEERGIEIRYFGCNNSAGIIDLPDMKHDLVRAGISIYGMYPSDEVDKEAVILKPALTLTSHVTYVKEVESGRFHQLWRYLCGKGRRCAWRRYRSDTETVIHALCRIRDMYSYGGGVRRSSGGYAWISSWSM